MNGSPTVTSLFTGLGGLDLGFELSGYNISWANDIFPSAAKCYKMNFGRELVVEDISSINLKEIPKTDIVIGGPPCQSFSLVGKRNKLDTRGQLVFRYFEIVQELRPKAFVMENVPGLASSYVDGERLPEFLQKQFKRLGYQVSILQLDASEFLVPQKRKRIFIIGTKKHAFEKPDGRKFAKRIYKIDGSSFEIGAKAAIGDLGSTVSVGEPSKYNSRVKPSQFASLMRKRNNSLGVSLHETPTMSEKDLELISAIPPGGNYMNVPDEIATPRILNFKRTGGRTTAYSRLHPNKPSYTVNTHFRRPNVGSNIHYSQDRLITAREAMRFQSIPDHFRLDGISKSDRNTLIGNAVPTFLSQAIAFHLLQYLD